MDKFTLNTSGAAMTDERTFYLLECPSCEWDCITGPPTVGDLGLTCPLCAGDNGRDVQLRTKQTGAADELPVSVEGRDARKHAFSDLAQTEGA
jgi:hypothetical protein